MAEHRPSQLLRDLIELVIVTKKKTEEEKDSDDPENKKKKDMMETETTTAPTTTTTTKIRPPLQHEIKRTNTEKQEKKRSCSFLIL